MTKVKITLSLLLLPILLVASVLSPVLDSPTYAATKAFSTMSPMEQATSWYYYKAVLDCVQSGDKYWNTTISGHFDDTTLKANAAQLRGGCWCAKRDGGLVGALVVAVVLGRELVPVAAFADPGIGAFASWGVEPGEEFIDRAGEVVSFRGGGKIPRGR